MIQLERIEGQGLRIEERGLRKEGDGMITEIICTLGPSTDNAELLAKMLKAGMDVARFNFSHGSHEDVLKRMDILRQAMKIADRRCALLADTKGPEMRLGLFEHGSVELFKGDKFVITTKECLGTNSRAWVNYSKLPKDIKVGAKILLADGALSLVVKDIQGDEIVTEVTHGGTLSDRKRIACPGLTLNMPFLSATDKDDIRFAKKQGFDYIAASFVQNGENVAAIRRLLGRSKIKIIAKIENAAGVYNLEEIAEEADGIMVARGDLGVEMPVEELPIIQKRILHLCHVGNKIGITATQMLESMCHSYRPTRAEVSDVANAVFDHSSMVMLSGETAAGEYPLEAVTTMAKIVYVTENSDEYRDQMIAHFLHKTE